MVISYDVYNKHGHNRVICSPRGEGFPYKKTGAAPGTFQGLTKRVLCLGVFSVISPQWDIEPNRPIAGSAGA